jgi:hypothetical protein
MGERKENGENGKSKRTYTGGECRKEDKNIKFEQNRIIGKMVA